MLQLQASPGFLRVGVCDAGADRPVVRITRPEDTATGGRGLLITAALAAEWGVRPDSDGPGKTVWFTIGAVGPA